MKHSCPRCGFGSSHDTWADRHPVAATILAVIALTIAVTHPWLVGVAAVGGAVCFAHHERRRRQALAARADWEHQALMAASLKWPAHPKKLPARPAPAPRRRGADHWSTTEPLRTGRNRR